MFPPPKRCSTEEPETTTESESLGSETSSHALQSDTVVENARHDAAVIAHDDNDDTYSHDTTAASAMTVTSRPFPRSTDDMRAKMALALEEHLGDHPDSVRARYGHTLEIERSSPKPCIVPGNALQLIDDDADTAHTTPSIIILSNNGSQVNVDPSHDDELSDPETSSAEPQSKAALQRRPMPKVRFRSRVRITSGLRKHRHSTSSTGPNGTQSPSTCSSCSGSPSSSISAPLRWHADENATWGPLGRRLSAYAHSNGWPKRSPTSPKQSAGGLSPRSKGARADERTPLISSSRARVAYVDSGLDGGGEADDERPRMINGEYEDEDLDEAMERSMRALALRREEDAVFGKWPWRLFNRHVSV